LFSFGGGKRKTLKSPGKVRFSNARISTIGQQQHPNTTTSGTNTTSGTGNPGTGPSDHFD